MNVQGQEKQRASNIIWNAAENYAFKPDFEAYDREGKAQLYWNYIIGAVNKYYDYAQIQAFLNVFQGNPNHVFYESLAWIGLENCAYQKGLIDRPVLKELRLDYARKVLQKADAPSLYYLVDEVKNAHFLRVLGEQPVMRDQVREILDDLELDASLNTGQIIHRLNDLISLHFIHNKNLKQNPLLNAIFSSKNRLRFGNPFWKLMDTGKASAVGNFNSSEKKEIQKSKFFQWQSIREYQENKGRAFIQSFYGVSLLSDGQTKELENILCTGNHRNCRLHFTHGEFATELAETRPGAEHKKAIMTQREKNHRAYQKHSARNNTQILKLTHTIKNAMLLNLEVSPARAQTGRLVSSKVWRAIAANDDKVFLKYPMDDKSNLGVDILLDASCSQIDRQEIISSQGFIIAESMSRSRIPVKVYSFCTNRNFTVFNLFREYQETWNNEKIFNYYASGCNRDGLGIRTALHMMQRNPYKHKVLIILTDGKPMDPQGMLVNGSHPGNQFYADAPAVKDTATEVRTGQMVGVSILCVFTGLDEDIPAAKKMYGNNLVRIKTPEAFADVLGVLMQNQLKNL